MASKSRKLADRPLQSPRVILCEGADEWDILNWIRTHRGLDDGHVELVDVNGRTNLKIALDDLRFQSGGSDVRLVGVVLDAEEQGAVDSALQDSLSEVARAHGFDLSIHVLPDAQSKGALETLVRRYADAAAPAASCANAWELCLAATNEGRTTAKRDKTWGQVWLAGQGAFHSRIGHALANNPDVRARLPLVIQHFETLLDEVLNTPLK